LAKYKAGHAPEHLRHAFEHAVEDYLNGTTTGGSHLWYFDADARRRWNEMGPEERLRWASGTLWRRGDPMPGWLCEMLAVPEGSSYAAGSRAIRATLLGRREAVL
jgi:hypothetical protein